MKVTVKNNMNGQLRWSPDGINVIDIRLGDQDYPDECVQFLIAHDFAEKPVAAKKKPAPRNKARKAPANK